MAITRSGRNSKSGLNSNNDSGSGESKKVKVEEVSTLSAFFAMLQAIIGIILKSVVAFNSRDAIVRSAVFLLCFTVVHALG